MRINAEDRFIVALDVSSLEEAEKLLSKLSGTVKVFKIGKELFTSAGPEIVRRVHSQGGKVFLDLKFHDIPNTVAGACTAATKLGVFMLNVHASGGRKMMSMAADAVQKAASETGKSTPILLGVTVLTSMGAEDLAEVGVSKNLQTQVQDLAKLSKQCGLGGVVASGQEIELIRNAVGNDFYIVTPGVRPAWAAAGDQKRIVTPKEAMDRGASFIVVGRPITHADNPKYAAEQILNEIKSSDGCR
jgi:orotidine-5'-phosphate decarboxylase